MNAPVQLPQAREVCPTTTRRLLGEGALLLDVRERAEVEQVAFAVPSAVALPLSELEQRFGELPRDRPLVVACDDGSRSLKATYYLMFQGYTEVAHMAGGLAKWARRGFPVRGDASVLASAPSARGSADRACCA